MTGAFIQRVDDIVADLLPRDPSEWCAQYRKKGKIIHDGLWGTFALHPHEVAILDTPLLQRLRFIHQTGAVFLTYPSAVHTRFEHSLGVLHQATRMYDALRERHSNLFDRSQQMNIRAAALLHDVGHGPFSHTSEQYFASLDQIANFANEPSYANSGAGEILSSLIVQSAPFRSFIRCVNSTLGQEIDCDQVNQIITGTTGPDAMYLSEFIHGPFDADKMDYMHRDGMYSGLTMHVDMDRLLASVCVKSCEVDGERQCRLAGNVAGVSPLMQILFNKMLLFTGIYHHHKVRTVDCMLWAIFDIAFRTKAWIGGVKVVDACDFLQITDDRLLVPELTDNDDIKVIIQAIRSRRLWKRALVIAHRTMPQQMHVKKPRVSEARFGALANLADDRREHISRRRKIAEEIWIEAGRPCELHEVWIDLPTKPSTAEAGKMWIESPGLPEPETLDCFIPMKEWVALYGTHKWQGHVICPENVIQVIGNAAKSVLKRRFGLEFLPAAQKYADS